METTDKPVPHVPPALAVGPFFLVRRVRGVRWRGTVTPGSVGAWARNSPRPPDQWKIAGAEMALGED